MNFEKVELFGFKSFADKAEIKFGNGITGIVGPNGCGKSNVADAIRWVLGEQSAKTLRGTNMQDVIFSGTQNRKSLSYCEVSLFFDNSNKMFSLDYNEVIITRKLYRSGESEYFINKQPSRLKDIVDLLHECGIGKEGYSIIGQGKVEEIMSAKPEDRRAIFEEATGIAKFKTRKLESERKLDRTHENLVRYLDILTEIENQLAPLEKQAEKAKEFNELSEQLKYHELNTYIAKVDGVATAKSKIQVKIDGIAEQTRLRQKEFDEAQAEYDKFFNDITDADNKLRDLNNNLTEKRVGIEKSSGAKQLYEQRISYLKSQIERANEEIKQNVDLMAECESSKLKNTEEIGMLGKKLDDLNKRFADVEKKFLKISKEITLGEELAHSNRQKIIDSIETLSNFKVNKGTVSAEKNSLSEKKEELTSKLDALSVKRDGYFNTKETVDKNIDELDRAVFDYKNKISDKEEEVHDCNEKVAEIDNKLYSLNSLVSALKARGDFYKSMKDSYEGYSPSVKLLMTKAKDNEQVKRRIKGVVAELIKADKKFDIALEIALAAAAQNVVTETLDDAKYLIEYLKENKFGRVTFLPIASVRPREQSIEVINALNEKGSLGIANELVSFDSQFENVISNLLGNTLIVDTLENATQIAKKYRQAFKMVTLDGDLFTPQGAVTGGSRKQESLGLLSNDRKLEENAKQLEEKTKEMDSLSKAKKIAEEKRDVALNDLSLLNDIYGEKRQQLVLEREKQSTVENSLAEVGREIEVTSDLIDEVNSKLAEVSSHFENMESGGKKLEQDRASATLSADKSQAEYDALTKERERISQESTAMQIEITELKGKIASLSNDNERLIKTVAETEQTNKELARSNEGAEGIIEELKREEEKVALTKEELDTVNEIRSKIDNIEQYKEDLRLKLNKNAELRDSLTNQLNELSEKKHQEELSLTKIDSDLEYMGQSILEDYEETYETALKFKAENYDANEGEQEIVKLRKRRSSLGSINADAIEDSKALRERYNEMITQKEDLEKAEADLQEAISKIKTEMLAQFDKGFTVINENFQKIFKELFGGGRAMLELDYSQVEDRLEAGIEIIAEPPGKKLQKLSLLSGGEKALTAIAILFSILRMRPMPFCVLDEIEAALDEANVDRFARYLQKFSQETQFIVITHRKPTMEMADALFGVTMQEKGVSKMVSVKLSEAEAFDAGQAM